MSFTVLSALVADEVLFNSAFNQSSFLGKLDWLMRAIPDSSQRVLGLREDIAPKCRVLHFPVEAPVFSATAEAVKRRCVGVDAAGVVASVPKPRLRVGWNHRWEYDKNPAEFFEALKSLHDKGMDFEVVVLGSCVC